MYAPYEVHGRYMVTSHSGGVGTAFTSRVDLLPLGASMGPRQTADNTLSYPTRSCGAQAGRDWTSATTGFGYAKPTPFFSLRLRGAQHVTYRLEAES